MDKIQSILDYQLAEIDLSYQDIALSIILAAICSAIIKYIYIKYSKSLSNKVVFSDIFILLSTVTCIVITILDLKDNKIPRILLVVLEQQ